MIIVRIGPVPRKLFDFAGPARRDSVIVTLSVVNLVANGSENLALYLLP